MANEVDDIQVPAEQGSNPPANKKGSGSKGVDELGADSENSPEEPGKAEDPQNEEKGEEGSYTSEVAQIIDASGKAVASVSKVIDSIKAATVTLPEVTADVKSVNDATESWQKVSFEKVIGEPLTAAIKAQGDAARATLKFIQDTGMTGEDNNKVMSLVSFNFIRDGKCAKLQIPLITLVPIPTLCIDEMTYEFKMKVDSSSDVTMTNTGSASVGFNFGAGVGDDEKKDGAKADASKTDGAKKTADGEGEKKPAEESVADAVKNSVKKGVTFSGSFSSKKDSSATKTSKYSVETTMDLKITLKQDDLPAGVATMLDVLNKSAEVVNPNGVLTVSADVLTLSSDGHAVVNVTYRDENGIYNVEKVKCTDLDGKAEKGHAIKSVDNVIFVLDEAGTYLISTDLQKRVIIVNPAKKEEKEQASA